jgi:hypothetical protein
MRLLPTSLSRCGTEPTSFPGFHVSLAVCLLIGACLAACGAGNNGDQDANSRDGSDATVRDATGDIVMQDHVGLDVFDSGTIGADVTDAGASDAAVDCGTPPSSIPYAEHSTNEEFTDPPSCTNCPGAFTGLTTLDMPLPADATTVMLDGTSAGATQCEWYVIGGACGVTHGTLLTDPDGAGIFQATIPVFCGTNTVRVVCSNANGHRVYVRQLQGTQCPAGGRDLRVTLGWDNLGTDMELHLVRAGGHINTDPDDCTWYTCVSRQPAWGADAMHDPRKDVDNTGYYGPENIFLDSAPPGTYNILVEFWGTGAPSTNEVDVTIRERTVAHLTHPMLPLHWVWYIGSVSFPAGTFTPVDSLTDCTASWRLTSMGCDLPLP